MKDGPNIARIASLIGDNARADVLTALMADRAMTATELAHVAGVSKQTISAHLAKLVDANLLAMAVQGRHHYFRLANHDVADLLESLMGVAFRAGAVRLRSSPRDPALRRARTCYDHLAGEWAVLAFENLLAREVLTASNSDLSIGSGGAQWFHTLGIDLDLLKTSKRALCRHCLDWSERRHHLGGALGAALLQRVVELGWALPVKDSRLMIFNPPGERAFLQCFGQFHAPQPAV